MSAKTKAEMKWDICNCGHPKYKHVFGYIKKQCNLCKCNNYEFLEEMTDAECKIKFPNVGDAANYKIYYRKITTTINLKDLYDYLMDITVPECHICNYICTDEEKMLAHLNTHTDKEIQDFKCMETA